MLAYLIFLSGLHQKAFHSTFKWKMWAGDGSTAFLQDLSARAGKIWSLSWSELRSSRAVFMRSLASCMGSAMHHTDGRGKFAADCREEHVEFFLRSSTLFAPVNLRPNVRPYSFFAVTVKACAMAWGSKGSSSNNSTSSSYSALLPSGSSISTDSG